MISDDDLFEYSTGANEEVKIGESAKSQQVEYSKQREYYNKFLQPEPGTSTPLNESPLKFSLVVTTI